MKTSLFFVFLIIISVIFNLNHVLAAEDKVNLTVTIDEYLSYSILDNQIHVATNSPVGFYLVNNNQVLKTFGPTEQTLVRSDKPVIVTANF